MAATSRAPVVGLRSHLLRWLRDGIPEATPSSGETTGAEKMIGRRVGPPGLMLLSDPVP